jgi:hypothetical protein
MVRVGGIGRVAAATAVAVAMAGGLTGCGAVGAALLGQQPAGTGTCRWVAPEAAQQILGARFKRVFEDKPGGCTFVLTDGTLDASVDPASTPQKIADHEYGFTGAEQVTGLGDRALYRDADGAQHLLVESGTTIVEVDHRADPVPGEVEAQLVALVGEILTVVTVGNH